MRLLLILFCLIATSSAVINVLVDISNWQGKVNFKLAKSDGIRAIIHKATQGTNYVDRFYSLRRRQAEKEGLLWGAYHFGVGGVSGRAQADHFLKTVGDSRKVLLVLDLERNPAGRTMSVREAEDFIGRVKQVSGRLPVVYGSPAFLSTYNSALIRQCPLWVASWTAAARPTMPRGKASWIFWQYTNGVAGGTPRSVRGIGSCDRDKFNGNLHQLLTKWPHF